ncbi:hypothetical protein B566_EDAN001449, partial [Ephemera danica]
MSRAVFLVVLAFAAAVQAAKKLPRMTQSWLLEVPFTLSWGKLCHQKHLQLKRDVVVRIKVTDNAVKMSRLHATAFWRAQADYIQVCKRSDPEFDACVVRSIESLRGRLGR